MDSSRHLRLYFGQSGCSADPGWETDGFGETSPALSTGTWPEQEGWVGGGCERGLRYTKDMQRNHTHNAAAQTRALIILPFSLK